MARHKERGGGGAVLPARGGIVFSPLSHTVFCLSCFSGQGPLERHINLVIIDVS